MDTMERAGQDQRVISHIVSELRPGGVEVRTYELLKHLDLTGQRHVIYTMSGRKGPLSRQYEELPSKVIALDLRSWKFPLKFIGSLRREGVSVVHSNIHYSSGYLLALAYFAGVKTRICHFRSDGSKKSGSIERLKTFILKRLIDWFATSIVAVAPGALERAWSVDWESNPRCSVLQNGLDLDEYANAGPAQLSEIGLRTDAHPVIVHVGRADLPTKNRDKAVGVLSALVRYHPNAVLLFVGRDGRDERQAIENRARWERLGEKQGVSERIFYAGERPDVVNILRASDLFLLTSTLEGLPGVLLEAMAAGIPTVSTDIPGARYIEETVGGVRLLDPKATDDEWARSISDALNASVKSRPAGNESRALNGSPFDIRVSSQLYVSLWNA